MSIVAVVAMVLAMAATPLPALLPSAGSQVQTERLCLWTKVRNDKRFYDVLWFL